MNNFGDKVSFIWSVADLLRGPYKPAQYGRVILPLRVLRRLDCVLEPTKEAVLTKAAEMKSGKVSNIDPILNRVAKASFHNTSKLSFSKLKGDPNKVAANLTSKQKDKKGIAADEQSVREQQGLILAMLGGLDPNRIYRDRDEFLLAIEQSAAQKTPQPLSPKRAEGSRKSQVHSLPQENAATHEFLLPSPPRGRVTRGERAESSETSTQLKLSSPIKKAILSTLSERDESASICTDADGNPERDPELRDYENVPLKENVEEIEAEIAALEQDIVKMLREVVG